MYGNSWSEEIIAAIEAAHVVVVVASRATSDSRQVPREVERADSKGKRLVPFYVDDTMPSGSLEYYFGVVQILRGDSSSERDLAELIRAVTASLGSGELDPRAAPVRPRNEDDDLLALGRAICFDVREELQRAITPEDIQTVAEPRQGEEVKFIDLAANRRARNIIANWQRRHGYPVQLIGEDLDPQSAPAEGSAVVCCLDSIDGTQHWIRGRNLYCTALSLFRKESTDAPYRLRVSMVLMADGRLVVAREDTGAAFLDGVPTPLSPPKRKVEVIGKSHVCTVCRRPDHYRVLTPLLAKGSPFAGLYTFGGNPILAELALSGQYDAAFQADASSINDAQRIWDWLPGLHIASRAGCTVLGGDGKPLDVTAAANRAIAGESDAVPYVVATNSRLAHAVAAWLATADGATS